MRSRSADFQGAFNQLVCNHGYTIQEMLVLIKAYELYNSGKSQDDFGWLDASYDIAPGIFHSPLLTIAITDLRDKKPEFWESNDKDGRLRLSEVGRTYIEENPNLVETSKSILGGVSHVRRS